MTYLKKKLLKLQTSFKSFRKLANGTYHREILSRLDQVSQNAKFASNTLGVLDTLVRIERFEHSQGPIYAIVSNMPPADTGISTCSLMTYREAESPVHIFAPCANAWEYGIMVADPRLAGTQVGAFVLDCLPIAMRPQRYNAVVFTIGNSDHNIPIAEMLRDLSRLPGLPPIYVHIHDPCLLNVLGKFWDRAGTIKRAERLRHYGVDLPENATDADVLAKGVYGPRALLHGLNLAGVIVNSRAAKEIVEKELGPVRVIELFHPVLPVHPAPMRRTEGLRIGTFGIPSRSKKTDLVLSAFRKLRERQPDASLVIAGFQAAEYAASRQIHVEQGIEIYDAPSDQQFESLLASVDVGVQLRSSNMGESSGPVARLLYLGKPVVVSRLGAFSELGDAVAYLDEPETPERLVELIISASTDRQLPLAARRYCEDKSPAQFCTSLFNEISATYHHSLASHA